MSLPVYALDNFTAAVTAVEPFLVNLTISAFLIIDVNNSAAFNSMTEGRVKLLPFWIACIAALFIDFSE